MTPLSNEQFEMVDSYVNDWNKFARDVLRQRLDAEQQEIFYAIQTQKRISVKSGNSRGKDFLAACASLCFLLLLHPSKVINTAPTDRQAIKIMMSEIKKIYRASRVNLGARLLEREIKFHNREHHYLLAFKASDKSTEAWSGFHSQNIMVVATEASGLEQQTFDAIEGVLQGNSKLLLLFNPNTAKGESYRSVRAKDYVSFTLSSLDALNVRAKKIIIPGQVDFAWVQNKVDRWCIEIAPEAVLKEYYDFYWEGKWYRPNDLFRIKVLGQYGSESSDSLIPAGWLEASHNRWLEWEAAGKPLEPLGRAPGRFSTDVAGLGRDNTIHGERKGRVVISLFEQAKGSDRKTIHMQVAGLIAQKLKAEGCYSIIDCIGEGAGVYSRLQEQSFKDRVVSYKSSYSGKGLTDLSEEREFVNWRSYSYWALRDSLDPQYNINLMLPPDDQLDEELLATKYKLRSDGKVLIIDKDKIKEEIGRSPDRADVVAQMFAPLSHSVQDTPTQVGQVEN